MKKVISTTNAPAAIGPYSQAIEVNGMVFASGQIPVDPATGEVADSGQSGNRRDPGGNRGSGRAGFKQCKESSGGSRCFHGAGCKDHRIYPEHG